MKTAKTTFFGDLYVVPFDGSVWTSPCNGAQHSSAASAMRAELEACVLASGDDIEDDGIAELIDDAIGAIKKY